MTKSNAKKTVAREDVKPVETGDDRNAKLAERRAKILERAGVRARREASLTPREDNDRFYDPDDFGSGGSAASSEVAENDVGWLPLDGRPR